MTKHFWIRFIINEALGVVDAFIASGKLSQHQKVAAEQLIADGERFLATLTI